MVQARIVSGHLDKPLQLTSRDAASVTFVESCRAAGAALAVAKSRYLLREPG
jgi:hypothetical protein